MKIISCMFIASFFSCSIILHSVTKAEENSTPASTSETSATSVSSVTSVETSKTDGSTSTTAISSSVKSVLMVDSTNQCRTPIVEAVFKAVSKMKGVRRKWHCESAGIFVYSPEAEWNMDKRARSTLRNHGFKDRKHIAREVNATDFNVFDHILGMDEANVEDLRKLAPAGSKAKIELFSVYDPKKSKSIRYPYYDNSTTGFEECYKIAVRTCEAFLNKHAD